jgi:hypothetical protein
MLKDKIKKKILKHFEDQKKKSAWLFIVRC